VSLILPVDVIVAGEIKAGAANKEVPVNSIPDDSYIVDIGTRTIKMFTKEIRKCRTVMWNGPAGIYEIPEFSKGTRMIATLLSELDATTVVGGGSSAEVIQEMGLTDKITHVSTGGGASLRFMEGVSLPGVKALQDK
jgi:phosphoglycerate kinase